MLVLRRRAQDKEQAYRHELDVEVIVKPQMLPPSSLDLEAGCSITVKEAAYAEGTQLTQS